MHNHRMPDYKTEEKVKYAVVLTTLVFTLLVASAFAPLTKERAIRVRQMTHRAMHVAVVAID
jgi:hypothetical protein